MGDLTTGKLNQQITIFQNAGGVRDASGAITPIVTELGPIWAAVEFKGIGSDEKQLADQRTAMTTVNFTIRNNPNVTLTAKDEIVYRGVKYAIRSILEADPKRCFLIIETEQLGENYI